MKNRYYIDVKIEGTGWNRGFFGLTAQSGDKGVLYSLLPFTNWFYANNAYASYLDRAPDWNTNSKFEEKGNLPGRHEDALCGGHLPDAGGLGTPYPIQIS